MRFVLIIVLLLLGIAVNKGTAQKSSGFWEKYIQNMRRANYLYSLLLHREYAAERKKILRQEITKKDRKSGTGCSYIWMRRNKL